MIKADEFVRQKLADSKYAYEEEFEFICAQFEDIKKESNYFKFEKKLVRRFFSPDTDDKM